MSFLRIKENYEKKLEEFLNSLDDESFNTYTRWRSYFNPPDIAQKIIKENLSGEEIGWIFIKNDNIAGYEHLNFNHPFRRDVVKEGFIVSPRYAGKGVGSRMKQKCIEEAKKLDLYKVVALVYEKNWSSLHVDLKNNFLIGGIFFNEEKINETNRFLVYLERPIKLKAKQQDYFSHFENFYSNFQDDSLDKELLDTTNLDISEIPYNKINSILNFTKQNNRDVIQKFQNSNKILKNPEIWSDIIILKISNELVCLGCLEFFTDKNKKHVSKIQIIEFNQEISEKFFKILIKKLLELSKKYQIEKLWINIPQYKTKLIRSLINNNFVLEAVALGEQLINSNSITVYSLAHHSEQINSQIYKEKMNDLLKYK